MSVNFFDDADMLAPPAVLRSLREDGSFVLSSPQALGPYARCVGEWLEAWAERTPDAPALAERESEAERAQGRAGGDGWRRLSWGETRQQVGRIAQGLLDLELPPDAPIVVLSENAIDHLLLLLAGMHIGRAVCTVSSAYSRHARDYAKIHGILCALGPALVYAADGAAYGPALAGAGLSSVIVLGRGVEHVPGAMPFDRLAHTPEGPGVMQAFARITPDTPAKFMLTSGSTGSPKVVINTHRMLCANQQMLAQTWRFVEREKPVLCDWLPWSHTFGGNHNVHLVLRNGGTLVIDDGRPTAASIERTVDNLAQVQPTIYFNVPRGFEMMLPFLEADAELARAVLARMRMVFYSGAALPQFVWDRWQRLAMRTRGEPLWLTTAWGATETAPAVTSAHWKLERAGVIGLPLPGMELKFVPSGQKLELRVRGVAVFPGYRGAPQLTERAFDAEGFYCIGDAGRLADEARPELGVVFDGRIAEDFKLTTGTWVSVGTLRMRIVSALAPLAQDVVVTGHDRDEVGVLVFPSAAASGLGAGELATRIGAALAALAAESTASSQVPRRALVLKTPPNIEAGEITDKGYLNQSAALAHRAADVHALYADGPDVILAGGRTRTL